MNYRALIVAGMLATAVVCPGAGDALAQQPSVQQDVFKGKLFAPNVILENQDELDLSREQYTAIRQAVVSTQSAIAEHEWDLREAYQAVLAALDANPVSEDEVLALVGQALAAENEVKKKQVALLIELRNLLTDEQLATLRRLGGYE